MTGPRQSPQLNYWLNEISLSRVHSANPQLALSIENRGENHDGTESHYLDHLLRLRRLVGEWELSITLDVAHAASLGLDVCDSIEDVLPRLANVHLSDALDRSRRGGILNGLFRDHQLPGHGYLPIDDALATLTRAGYAGLLTLELSPASLHSYWPRKAKKLLKSAVEDVRARLSAAAAVAHKREVPRHPAV
jgi:sugar phosphate isomerase/epimerase